MARRKKNDMTALAESIRASETGTTDAPTTTKEKDTMAKTATKTTTKKNTTAKAKDAIIKKMTPADISDGDMDTLRLIASTPAEDGRSPEQYRYHYARYLLGEIATPPARHKFDDELTLEMSREIRDELRAMMGDDAPTKKPAKPAKAAARKNGTTKTVTASDDTALDNGAGDMVKEAMRLLVEKRRAEVADAKARLAEAEELCKHTDRIGA